MPFPKEVKLQMMGVSNIELDTFFGANVFEVLLKLPPLSPLSSLRDLLQTCICFGALLACK